MEGFNVIVMPLATIDKDEDSRQNIPLQKSCSNSI